MRKVADFRVFTLLDNPDRAPKPPDGDDVRLATSASAFRVSDEEIGNQWKTVTGSSRSGGGGPGLAERGAERRRGRPGVGRTGDGAPDHQQVGAGRQRRLRRRDPRLVA